MKVQQWLEESNRLQKLLRLATSANPHEAARARERAHDLQERLDGDPPDRTLAESIEAGNLEEVAAWQTVTQEMVDTIRLRYAVGAREVEQSVAESKRLDALARKRQGRKGVR